MNNRRLAQEYRKYQQEKSQHVENGLLNLYPANAPQNNNNNTNNEDEDDDDKEEKDVDLTHWKAIISPSIHSHYHHSIWQLDIKIPTNYPSQPPLIKFELINRSNCSKLSRFIPTSDHHHGSFKKLPTDKDSNDKWLIVTNIAPPHVNVNLHTGEICLDILRKDQWTPLWSLVSLCVAVVELLNDDGDLSSPLNVDLLNLVNCKDVRGVDGLIRYYIELNGVPLR